MRMNNEVIHLNHSTVKTRQERTGHEGKGGLKDLENILKPTLD